ncbi:MAG TPA: NotI family restriction endonuclease [Armatimonadota bacterium]|nr:NotI family restriction endonuclease [Armatimonadota bacterium]
MSPEAIQHRRERVCPFKAAKCTKDKKDDPLGVCSVFADDKVVITCPMRFRQDWLVAKDAASFFFPASAHLATLTEVRVKDKYGKLAGDIDLVLVSVDDAGRVLDFGALEVQAVYITGNVRNPFAYYMQNPKARQEMNWARQPNYPGPDYLSSSRKRLAPQLLFKGGILHSWGKKTAVALNTGFFETLPALDAVACERADIAWFVYDLEHHAARNVYTLKRRRVVYTKFEESLAKITRSAPGPMADFVRVLQKKLATQLEGNSQSGVSDD